MSETDHTPPAKDKQAAIKLAKELGTSTEFILAQSLTHSAKLQEYIQKEDQETIKIRTESDNRLKHHIRLLLVLIIVGLVSFKVIEIANFKPLLFIGWPAAFVLVIMALSIGIFGIFETRRFRKFLIKSQRRRYGLIIMAKDVSKFENVGSILFDAREYEKPADEDIIKKHPITMQMFRVYQLSLIIATGLTIAALLYMGYAATP